MSAKGPIGKLLGLFLCVVLIRFILWSIMATSRKRKLTAVCSHQTRIGNLDAHLI